MTSAAVPAPPAPLTTYLATVVVTGSLIATGAWLAGLADLRALSSGPAALLVLALFGLFWPCFSLALARLAERRYARALGLPLHALTGLTLMAAQFGKPALLSAVPGELAMLALALLLAWLVVEAGVLRGAEAAARHLWSRSSESRPAGVSA